MLADRTFRCLSTLNTASSSRVLNLAAIDQAQTGNENHGKAPLFISKVLNSAIILKHRLRADEVDLFAQPRVQATKIIVPFQKTNLRSGGQSIFIGQKGFAKSLADIGRYKDPADIKRDLDVLRLFDKVPSLDPFLLREYLRDNGIRPDASYFEISSSDQNRMHEYTMTELRRLTALVSGKGRSSNQETERMVSALLSTEVTERLEPLRMTLNLKPEDFSEGVFSWRGFIYYKWSLTEFWPNLIKALREMQEIRPLGKVDADQKALISACRGAILRGAKENSDKVREIITVYENAYSGLIERQDPKTFRDFLLSAPALFLTMGEKMGALSHVTSFWQYRFPPGAPRSASVEELAEVLQDFVRSFGMKTQFTAPAALIPDNRRVA
ncbi:MAG: hypothetical protein ABI608_05595 [Rhizomicrobium sp.]